MIGYLGILGDCVGVKQLNNLQADILCKILWSVEGKKRWERKIDKNSIRSKAKPHSPQTYSSEKKNKALKRVGAEKN